MPTAYLILFLLLVADFGHAADGERRITFTRAAKKGTVLLSVASDTFAVTFNTRHAWNVGSITYLDHIIGLASGATGTVIHWDGKAVGTGHGGELVESVSLLVDGREVPLVTAGKNVFTLKDEHTGKSIALTKRSTIGPLRLVGRFEFPVAGDGYVVTQSYEVMEDITPERFTGYKYTFMHMMPETFTDWQTFRADGTTHTGSNAPGKTTEPRDPDAEINTPFQAIACFSPEWSLGVAYVYPREYEGSNHLLHRGGEDNKFRAMLFRDSYRAREKFEFKLRVAPFAAGVDDWKNAAKKLASDVHF